MSKKYLSLVAFALLPFLSFNLFAQSDLEERVKALENKAKIDSQLKFSGYGQFDYRNIERHDYTESGFPTSQNELRIRRGRLRAEYNTDLLGFAFQLCATQTGVTIRDLYIDFKDPLTKFLTLRAGNFRVAMGHEILQSTPAMLSVERSRVTNTMIPGDRDIAAMLIIQAPKDHFLNPFRVDLQVVNGAGTTNAYANRKNFVARLNYTNTFGDFRLGVGAATYQGGTYQGNSRVFTMESNEFKLNDNISNVGQYAPRTYYQCELVTSYKSQIGLTSLTGEFWAGKQSGTATSSTSPTVLPTGDTYIRPFNGFIAQLGHQILNTGLTVAAKYDIYNPNTKVSGNEIGMEGSNTSATDLSYATIGIGLIYEPVRNVRFTLWYNMITNETSDKLADFNEDRRDNILTLRMQVRF